MFDGNIALMAAAIFAMALLYSTVGHGGGSGYLAIMAIAGFAPEEMRSTALLLNVVVSLIATWKFGKAGKFRRELFFPLICASVPAAFVGGYIELSPSVYRPIVGIVLLFAAARLFIPIRGAELTKKPNPILLLIVGAIIGVSSGVIGIGGGIFLSPLILLLGWSTAKQTAAISAPFILLNSIAGLGGIAMHQSGLLVATESILQFAIAVVIGGFVGASFGSKHLGHHGLRKILGIVLLIASIKMFLTAPSTIITPLENSGTLSP